MLLQVSTPDDMLTIFEAAIAGAGGTAFALVEPQSGCATAPPLRGLIGWCTYHDLQRSGVLTAPRTLFWKLARIDGVHATGEFVIGAATGFEPVGGLIAPVPNGGMAGRAIFVEIESGRLNEETEHWLTVLCVALQRRLLQAGAEEPAMSERERSVIAWLAEGKSTEDAADILGISPATVMFHYRNVAARYGTLNRTHTVVEAMRRGELPLRYRLISPSAPAGSSRRSCGHRACAWRRRDAPRRCAARCRV